MNLPVRLTSMLLTALELVCFGAISLGVAVAGWAIAGPAGGVSAGLIVGGGCGVYLVNAYSMPVAEEGEDDA